MVGRPLRLRVIALAAAYAVALQGLLAAFVPIAMAAPAGILCSGEATADPGVPAGHEPSCASACAMLGAPAGPPPPGVVIAAVRGYGTSEPNAPETPPSTASVRGSHAARAPPFVHPTIVRAA